MTDILFGQSYYLRFDPKLWEAMQPYPPLGTLYAASYIRSLGYDVALFDAMLAGSEQEWEAALLRSHPRVAVLCEDNFNYLSKMCLVRMRQAAFTMIDMARRQGCTVIVAGSDATDAANLYLARGAQYVLTGEGEHTLGHLLQRLLGQSDTPLEEIAGLAFISGTEVHHTPRRPDIRDLDALPFPAWDLIDVERYRSIWLQRHGRFSLNMVTTRGCPFHCNWCAKPIWGQRYNSRSPENVAAELLWLHRTYKPDHIWFADDIMGLKPRWLDRFADLLEAEGVRIPFKSLHRADLLLRPRTVDALRRAGAESVWLGAESGSQKVLDAMDKGTQVEQILEATNLLQKSGIAVGWFLQFGYPGETRQDIERTLQMVRDGRPDDIGVSVSYPLPGTPFHESVRRGLGPQQHWQDSADLAMLYRGPFTTAFYRQLYRVLHHEFRARKAGDDLWRVAHAPRTVRPHHLRRAASSVVHRLSLPVARRRLESLAEQEEAPLPGSIGTPAVEL